MASRYIISLFLLSFFLLGCGKKRVLHNEVSFGKIKATADIVDIDKKNGIDVIFQLSVADSTYVLEYGVANQQEYLDRIYYFSYQSEKDFWIEYNDKPYPCIGAVFERNYKLDDKIILHLHFDYPEELKENEELFILYHAHEFKYPFVKLKFKV